jgi:hypothetical protein
MAVCDPEPHADAHERDKEDDHHKSGSTVHAQDRAFDQQARRPWAHIATQAMRCTLVATDTATQNARDRSNRASDSVRR